MRFFIIMTVMLFSISALFLACGGGDGSSGGGTDAAHAGDAGTDLPAEATAADLDEATAGDLGPGFEGFGADTAVLAAASAALDSDEVFAVVDAPGPPPMPPIPAPGSDCVDRTVLTGVVELDYAACPHAQGTISMVRQDFGTWLLKFNDGYSIYGVSISGFLVIVRVAAGEFTVLTCDKDAGMRGTVPVRLSWQGKTAGLSRDVYLIGKLLAVEQPLKYFHLTGDGFVVRPGVVEKHKLGVGGEPDKAKNEPIQFPRPLDARCPHGGKIELQGLFTALAKAVVSFTVRDATYKLEVDLGEVGVDGDLGVTFDKAQSGGIGALALAATGAITVGGAAATGPVAVTDANVIAALEKSTLAADVKTAIREFATKKKDKLPTVPLAGVVDGVAKAFKTVYAEGLCAGQ